MNLILLDLVMFEPILAMDLRERYKVKVDYQNHKMMFKELITNEFIWEVISMTEDKH